MIFRFSKSFHVEILCQGKFEIADYISSNKSNMIWKLHIQNSSKFVILNVTNIGFSCSLSFSLFLLCFPRLILNSMSLIRHKLRANYEMFIYETKTISSQRWKTCISCNRLRLSFDKLMLNHLFKVLISSSEAFVYEHVSLYAKSLCATKILGLKIAFCALNVNRREWVCSSH